MSGNGPKKKKENFDLGDFSFDDLMKTNSGFRMLRSGEFTLDKDNLQFPSDSRVIMHTTNATRLKIQGQLHDAVIVIAWKNANGIEYEQSENIVQVKNGEFYADVEIEQDNVALRVRLTSQNGYAKGKFEIR